VQTSTQSINMLHQKHIAQQMNVSRGYSGSRGEQKHSEKCKDVIVSVVGANWKRGL